MLQLTFNPGLTLTGFPTTRPWTTGSQALGGTLHQYMGQVPPGSLALLYDQNLRSSVPIYDPAQNLIL